MRYTATGKGNDAQDEIRRDNVWKWVEPVTWIDTNWWDPEGDGLDNFDGSLLDFAFVAGPAKDWESQCEVIVELNDFPDDETTCDHRPISLKLQLAPEQLIRKGVRPSPARLKKRTKTTLLQRVGPLFGEAQKINR
jgi:hypothetical protein